MKKYKLEIKSWKKSQITFFSYSFLDIYNKYLDVRTLPQVEIRFFALIKGKYLEMDNVSNSVEKAKEAFVIREWEQFTKYLDEDFKM